MRGFRLTAGNTNSTAGIYTQTRSHYYAEQPFSGLGVSPYLSTRNSLALIFERAACDTGTACNV